MEERISALDVIQLSNDRSELPSVSSNTAEMTLLRDKLSTLKSAFSSQQHTMEAHERNNRKNNLVIAGIEEDSTADTVPGPRHCAALSFRSAAYGTGRVWLRETIYMYLYWSVLEISIGYTPR